MAEQNYLADFNLKENFKLIPHSIKNPFAVDRMFLLSRIKSNIAETKNTNEINGLPKSPQQTYLINKINKYSLAKLGDTKSFLNTEINNNVTNLTRQFSTLSINQPLFSTKLTHDSPKPKDLPLIKDTPSSTFQPLAKNLYQRRPITTLTYRRHAPRQPRRKCSTLSNKNTELQEPAKVVPDPLPKRPIKKRAGKKTVDVASLLEPKAEADPMKKEAVDQIFSKTPKSLLHSVYTIVSTDLKNADLKLQPIYTPSKEKAKGNFTWCCTYNPKWPEPTKFQATAHTKQEASHKAAQAVLIWLKKNGKITADGHPIILNPEEVDKLVKKTTQNLSLEPSTLREMNELIELHQSEFVPILVDKLTEKDDSGEQQSTLSDAQEVSFRNRLNQKFLGPHKYMAKEKVNLPISDYKQTFIDLLKANKVVIVKGEPGCGKSTRIPQYVLEAWITGDQLGAQPCRIAVTQPRRIAAISLSDRVSSERDETSGHIVGYQVRLKSNFNQSTGRILYCTTGILLRHLQSDPNLSNFTHVILDEAHERDVNTDLLMNLLRSTIEVNDKLKLIVMSATIDTEMFQNYFNGAPIMHVPGFTHPVTSYFLDDLSQVDLGKTRKMAEAESPTVVHEDVVKLINFIHKTKDEGAILCFLPGWEDISKIQKSFPYSGDLSVLCLHSRLQDSEQWKIFSRPPPGVRKVILATNIAETSVTIDDVVYVIDTGIHKESRFDVEKGVVCIDNHWVAQSSMIQRKGRAGRVRPGESFHLYTRSKYNSFAQFTDPEILKTSLTKIILDSKVYSNNMDALEFMSQLPSPPEKTSTRLAVRELKNLELLDDNEKLTPLGRTLANFQLEPKLAKVLVNAVVYKCCTPIVDIITMFSADSELFAGGLMNKENIKRIKMQGSKDSDHLAMMRLFEGWLELMEDGDEWKAKNYCHDANLVHYKLLTIEKLRKIHFDYLYNGLRESLSISDNNSDNDELVKAILFSGVGTLLQHRNWDVVKGRHRKSNVFLTNYSHKATITSESVNFKKTSFPSNLLVYINEVRSNVRRTTLIRECSVISPLAVLLFSNKGLTIKDGGVDDEVIIGLEDTKIAFLCNREEAQTLSKCKEALGTAYQYFIFQMTQGGEFNSNINKVWDKMLQHLSTCLR